MLCLYLIDYSDLRECLIICCAYIWLITALWLFHWIRHQGNDSFSCSIIWIYHALCSYFLKSLLLYCGYKRGWCLTICGEVSNLHLKNVQEGAISRKISWNLHQIKNNPPNIQNNDCFLQKQVHNTEPTIFRSLSVWVS